MKALLIEVDLSTEIIEIPVDKVRQPLQRRGGVGDGYVRVRGSAFNPDADASIVETIATYDPVELRTNKGRSLCLFLRRE